MKKLLLPIVAVFLLALPLIAANAQKDYTPYTITVKGLVPLS